MYAVQMDTKLWYLNIAHRILQIIEFKAKPLGTVTTRSIKLKLLSIIHYTRAMKCACESR